MKKSFLFLILSFMMLEVDAQISFVGGQYMNGQISYSGSLAGVKETGLWKYFNENGTLESTGDYSNGVKIGVWEYYNKYGAIESVENYSDVGKAGDWKYYNKGLKRK